MTLKEFIKTRTFKVNAIAALGITVMLIVFIVVFLRFYTHHGDTVVIPDLKGRTVRDVADILDRNGLRFEIRDSVYSAQITPGTVLDQYPKPGMKVKENRMIFITLSALNQEMIPMPQLTDISYRQAINLIQTAGLIAGSIQYKPSEFPDLVLEQKVNGESVAKGEMIPKGSRVDLVLGSNGEETAGGVPSLIGQNLTDARSALEGAYLSIGTITYDETITSEDQKDQALIWKQSPAPAESPGIERGTAIDVWLTVDPNKIQEKTDTVNPENTFF